MVIYFDVTGSVETLGQRLDAMQERSDIAGIAILAADGNGFSPGALDPLLHHARVPIFGAIFPAIIYRGKTYTKGTLVVGLPVEPRIVTVQHLSQTDSFPLDLLAGLGEPTQSSTAFLWVDSFAQAANVLLDALYNRFGLAFHVLGGGAVSVQDDEEGHAVARVEALGGCLLYTSPSPRDRTRSRMPSSA